MEDCQISVTATSRDNVLNARAEMFSLNEQEWSQKMALIQSHGHLIAERMRKEGHGMAMELLAPREIQDVDSPILSAVGFPVDWKTATRLDMVKSANEILSNAWLLGPVDGALPVILAQVIEGKSLYEHGIGEFFELYGLFEGKYQVSGADAEAKMNELLNGDEESLKYYCNDKENWRLAPLPYAVRNTLAHKGTTKNRLDEERNELNMAIGLLKSWVADRQSANARRTLTIPSV